MTTFPIYVRVLAASAQRLQGAKTGDWAGVVKAAQLSSELSMKGILRLSFKCLADQTAGLDLGTEAQDNGWFWFRTQVRNKI